MAIQRWSPVTVTVMVTVTVIWAPGVGAHLLNRALNALGRRRLADLVASLVSCLR
jgi:hypothetical protein